MPRIVHLGLGNFHRAHQAWYTHHANRRAGSEWRITGVSMTRRDLRDALAGGAGYTLAERGAHGLTCTRITVHDRVLVAADAPGSVIAALADPEVHVVTVTVTEKGYHLGTDGGLDLNAPAIAQDLAANLPQSAIGLLAHGLARRARDGHPVTVLSCDNLGDNGQRLAAAVADYAAAAGLSTPTACSFPNTMVDRITPATSPAIAAEIAAATGHAEPAPVLTESFSEWVIENRFAGPRPDWDLTGAVFTEDVGPFEARKLRCLNAAHSALAYGGLLRGHRYVHEAFADPALHALITALWQEARKSLPEAARADLPAYLRHLSDRFAIAAMHHRLDQIATDGSQKIPQRLLPIFDSAPLTDRPATIRAIAAWVAYVAKAGPTDQFAADPGADHLRKLASAGDPAALIDACVTTICPATHVKTVTRAVRHALPEWATSP